MKTTVMAAALFVGLAALNPLHAEEGKKEFTEKQLAQHQ